MIAAYCIGVTLLGLGGVVARRLYRHGLAVTVRPSMSELRRRQLDTVADRYAVTDARPRP